MLKSAGVKLLEENVVERQGQARVPPTASSTVLKGKTDEVNFDKNVQFCVFKSYKESERQGAEWEEIFAKRVPPKGLYLENTKSSQHSSNKRTLGWLRHLCPLSEYVGSVPGAGS